MGGTIYLSGDPTDVNREALPQRGQIIESVAARQPGNEKWSAVLESWGFELYHRHVFGVCRHSFLLIVILHTRKLRLDSCQQLTTRADRSAAGSGLHLEGHPQFPDEYAPRSERPWLTMSSLSTSKPLSGYAGLRGPPSLSPIDAVPMVSMQQSTWCDPLQARMPLPPWAAVPAG
jgi:hypothetical protein